MPKKTKKEKLLAQRHRTKLSPVAIQIAPDATVQPLPVSQVSFTLPAIRKAPSAIAVSPEESRVLRADILKTIIFTTIILISEFLLARSLPQ
ncbi:hypothetical protein KJZ67_05860 [Patescibacteria group bacterium]|nr:hypothetical protein [Patescibacteria group bacterium]